MTMSTIAILRKNPRIHQAWQAFIFNLLASIVYTMHHLALPLETCHVVITTLCTVHELGETASDSLLTLVNELDPSSVTYRFFGSRCVCVCVCVCVLLYLFIFSNVFLLLLFSQRFFFCCNEETASKKETEKMCETRTDQRTRDS
jgi:hypothetical protein